VAGLSWGGGLRLCPPPAFGRLLLDFASLSAPAQTWRRVGVLAEVDVLAVRLLKGFIRKGLAGHYIESWLIAHGKIN
jgi:hypothetical protein